MNTAGLIAVATAVLAGVPIALVTLTRVFKVERPDTASKTVSAQWTELRQLRADHAACQTELTAKSIHARKVELENVDLKAENVDLKARLVELERPTLRNPPHRGPYGR